MILGSEHWCHGAYIIPIEGQMGHRSSKALEACGCLQRHYYNTNKVLLEDGKKMVTNLSSRGHGVIAHICEDICEDNHEQFLMRISDGYIPHAN